MPVMARIVSDAGRVRATMGSWEARSPHNERRPPSRKSARSPDLDRPWVTIVWNDPVNLMSYVTHVFMKVFGYSEGEGRPS